MTHIKAPRFALATIASLLALPIAATTFVPAAKAEIIIRNENFGIRIGGRRSPNYYPRRHHKYRRNRRRYHNRRRSSSVYRDPGIYGRGSVYRAPRVIYDEPDIIYRRTEVVGPNRRSRIILEDPEYIVPNRTIIRPGRRYRKYRKYRQNRRYNRQRRRYPTYRPGTYLIPTKSSHRRIFTY